MALPKFQEFMLPILVFLKDDKEKHRKDIRNFLIDYFHITDSELKALINSGRTTKFKNRTGWALTYLKHANLINSPTQGVYIITNAGKKVLLKKPNVIDRQFLSQFSEFREFANIVFGNYIFLHSGT